MDFGKVDDPSAVDFALPPLAERSLRVLAASGSSSPRGVPGETTLDGWAAGVPEGFRFCPKVHQSITHERGLRDADAMIASFASRLSRLPAACDVFERRRSSVVITDVAGRRDVSHGSLTAPFAFVRFVGDDLHATDFTRLDAWVDRLISWRAQGLEEAYFFVHQTDDLLAPETLVHLVRRAREKGVELPPFELV